MKKTLVIAAALTMCLSLQAQEESKEKESKEGFQFTTIKELPVTSVKDQASSGTCWCFSAISFIESEIIRQGNATKDDIDLSEMFVVSNAYADKAVKYIRLDGHLNYNQGSSTSDVFCVLREHGIVPNEVMPGLNYGSERHSHGELVAGLKGYLSGVLGISEKGRALSTAWHDGLKGILAAYLGPVPEKFTYKGKEYTPKSYYESLKINPDDYVDFTSWTHLSYYEKHPVEVADNWRWSEAYNVPLDDLIAIMDNSINNGYTFIWASDVSEKSFTRNGIAIAPDPEVVKKASEPGSDEAKWLGIKPGMGKFQINGPVKEIEVTPELRQKGYDEKTTTDDHGMHCYGLAKDQNGSKYYIIKNSWGTKNKYKGTWYVSETFVKYKTMDITVHRDAIPKDIKKKLGIK